MNEKELDRILNEMGGQEPHPREMGAAQERVWHRLSAGPACLRFQEQFAGYRDGSLSEAKRLLLDDHLTRCTECRRALGYGEREVIAMPSPGARPRVAWKLWAIAAGVAAVALLLGRQSFDTLMAPSGARASVKAVSGSLYALGKGEWKAGAEIGDGQVVRTGGGSSATLQLADGSLVELNERTELHVSSAWSGQTVHLGRGDIVVQATPQGRGKLRVVTRDSEAAVKGTIFTVSVGTAGSLVGVVEGSVAVTQPGSQTLLKPGEQSSTSPALGKITVRQAISWSKDAEKHFALLAELTEIEKQLPPIAARTQARLLPALPSDVVIYGAIPNLGATLNQAVALIEQRSAQSAVLQQWWSSLDAAGMKDLIERVRTFSPMLGDEVVFVLAKPGRDDGVPAVLAEIANGQQAALQQEITKLVPANARLAYRFVNNLLIVSDSPANLTWILGHLGQGAATPFAGEIADRYARGVSWLLAADVAGFRQKMPAEAAVLGADRVRYLFVEQRTVQGVEENEASLTFQGPRTGVASWLAAPGASGSAEYVSPDALAVVSAATRTPRQAFDEVYSLLSGADPKFAGGLQEMESATGVSVANDLASALGTDFTLAVETAALPIPGWFAALEVYRPDVLNSAIARLVAAHNSKLAPAEQNRQLLLSQETLNGRVWHSLSFGVAGFGLTWTEDRGYLLLGMDRGVLSRALSTRASGLSLIRSSKFRSRMPTLGGVHPSGFAWFNLEDAAALAGDLADTSALRKLLTVREPSLITFNGETERIQVASRTRLTSVLLDTMMTAQANER